MDGRGDERETRLQQLLRPLVVHLRRPVQAPQDNHGKLRFAHKLDVGQCPDLVGRGPGGGQGLLHGGAVGKGPVHGEGEPEGQTTRAPGQADRVVRWIPGVRGLQHLEVTRFLRMCRAGQRRFPIDQRAGVERREQPFVRINDEGVGVRHTGKKVTD